MNKKKWVLLICSMLLIAGYYKLFYKTWNNEGVAKNADIIFVADVKRITNTLIWDFLSNPSQWKNSDLFSSSEEDRVSWQDMIKLPDYVFIFHKTGEPNNALYTVVEVKDKAEFEKGIQQYHFTKTASGSFISKEAGIEFIQKDSKLLLGNAAVESREYIHQMADELFNKKDFISKDSLNNYVKLNSHIALSVPLFQHSSLEDIYFITGNFDNETITFSTSLSLKNGINLTTSSFLYCDSSLCSIGFTQPWPQVKQLLPDSSWAGISRLINFNIDSVLLQTNHKYQLDIPGVYARTDSAISYTYDDDFNQIEKVVVNKVEEPAFNFNVHGDSVRNIYHYWDKAGKLEKTGDSNLFTPVPFVKSYCKVKNDKLLVVTSANYNPNTTDKSIDCILFAKLLLRKIPPSVLGYFPPEVIRALENIESAELITTNEKGQIILRARLNKKKNDLPIIRF